nr:hypothetical protein BaRGS_014343 [Batillaria attramentaria]
MSLRMYPWTEMGDLECSKLRGMDLLGSQMKGILVDVSAYAFFFFFFVYVLKKARDAVTQGVAKQYASQFGSSITVNKLVPKEGNMTKQLSKQLPPINYNHIIGAEFLDSSDDGVLMARAFYNGFTRYGMPIALNYLLNSLAGYYAPGHTISSSLKVIVVKRVVGEIEPPRKKEDTGGKGEQIPLEEGGIFNKSPSDYYDYGDPQTPVVVYECDRCGGHIGTRVAVFISLGMAFFMPMVVNFLVKERLSGAKHIQMVSGVHPAVYWLSNLFSDFLVYLIPTGLIVAEFATFRLSPYVERGGLGVVLLVLLLYGWATLNFLYLAQFFFSSAGSSSVACIVYITFSGQCRWLST